MSLIIFIPLLALMWFFLIRPQQQRMKAQQALVQSLEPGDEVVLSSGIFGIITEVEGEILWLEVAQDLELKVLRSAVETRFGDEAAEDDDEDDAADDDGADDDYELIEE